MEKSNPFFLSDGEGVEKIRPLNFFSRGGGFKKQKGLLFFFLGGEGLGSKRIGPPLVYSGGVSRKIIRPPG